MAVTQLNYYSNSDTSIIDLQNTADGTFIGKHQVSLTNYDNTSLPAISIGSVVENNGSLFKFTTETAISGSPSDGTVYIYLVPSGDPALGTATVTPTFTNTAPTWSDSKQGWYGTGGSANYRYLEYILTKSGSSWIDKQNKTYFKNSFVRGYSCIAYRRGSSFSLTSGGGLATIPFDSLVLDNLSQYDPTTGILTFKESGTYRINVNQYVLSVSSTSTGRYAVALKLLKNVSTSLEVLTFNVDKVTTLNQSTYVSGFNNFIYDFAVGDTLKIQMSWNDYVTTTTGSVTNDSSFLITKL